MVGLTVKPLPKTNLGWVHEVITAYKDAHDTIPFGKLTGDEFDESSLFQLAPQICMKMRGIHQSKKKIKLATDAALSSYVATQEHTEGVLDVPQMAFAFCYVASHLGLGIIDETRGGELIGMLEDNLEVLIENTP